MSTQHALLLEDQESQAFLRLSTDAQREQFLQDHPQLLSPELVSQLTKAVHDQIRVDANAALSLAEAAQSLARRIGQRGALGLSLRAMANALYAKGDNTRAIERYSEALEQFEADGNALEVGITLSSSLQAHILLGGYDHALQCAEQARNIFSELGEARRLARLDINVGNILHRQDRFDEALTHYHRAYESLRSTEDYEAVAAVLSNLAICQVAVNDFQHAIESYQKARELCNEHGMAVLTHQADYNIAWLYYLRGEYSRAIQMLLADREECRKTGDAYEFALCYLDLSEIYLELNLSLEAEETAHEGRRLFREGGYGYEEAKCTANEAIALGQQRKAFRAIELFAEARKAFEKEKNSVWPSLIDLYQAFVLLEEGRLFEAQRACQSATAFFSAAATLPAKAAFCRLVQARIFLRGGDPTGAARECQAALGGLESVESPTLTYQAHALMGQIQRAARDDQAAYASFQSARAALEAMRSNLRGEELKIAFLKNKLALYEELVDISLNRGLTAETRKEAFLYIEEAKSRTLTDLLTGRNSVLITPDDGKSELVRQIRNLREELNWYYHRIDIEQLRAEEKSPERVQKLQKEVKTYEDQFVRALREMQATGDGPVDGSRTISLEGIWESLPAETTLLEYFTVGDRVLACVVTKDSLHITGVTLASRVVQLMRMFQFQISKFRLGREYVETLGASLLEATRSHLRGLYDELIAPIRETLKGQHLVVVPHGPLHYVPFHALHDGTNDLIDTYLLSYAPSASLFSICQKKPWPAHGGSLVLGVPDQNAPAIRDEVLSVAEILQSKNLFVGEEATIDVLKRHGPESRFVHIATHGEFRQDNPLFSSIRLGNSRLNLYDLYQMQLQAELVTLSGCATGMNAVAAGDELLGLVRGLLYSGARTLLLSLWDVNDRSTSEFMTSFYGAIRAGRSKPRALQEAMLEARKNRPHPYYWAPFFLVGKAF